MTMKSIKIIAGLIPVLFYIIPAGAQQKAIAPPTTIDLPGDSATTAAKPVKKVTIQDSRFNLPDVLVVGEDQTRKEIVLKQDFIQERPVLIKPALENNPVLSAGGLIATKPGILSAPPGNKRLTWGQLMGGGYSTLIIEAGHWQKLGFSDINMHGWFDKSNGEYLNSRYKTGGVTGKLKAAFSPAVSATINGGYEYISRGMYNALFTNNLRREIIATGMGSELFYGAQDAAYSVLGFEINNTEMTDDTTAQYAQRNDFRYNLYGNYTFDLDILQLAINGRFIRETFDVGNDSSKTKNMFGQIGLEALARLSPGWIVSLGASYQQSKADSIYKQEKLAPFVKLNIMPARRLGISLKYQSGLHYKTYSEWLAEIPYVSIQGPLPTDYEKHAVLVSIDFTPTDQFILNTGVNWRMMDEYTFGATDDSTRLVHLYTIPDLQLMDITAGFTANISAATQIQGSVIWYYDKIEQTPAWNNMKGLPYRPNYRIPINASFEVLKGTILVLSTDIYGPRTTTLTDNEKMNAFSLVNIGIKQKFGPFYAHVTVNNLLDSDYAVWQYYPDNGIHIIGGLSVRF